MKICAMLGNNHYSDSSADIKKEKAVSGAKEINVQWIKARWDKNAKEDGDPTKPIVIKPILIVTVFTIFCLCSNNLFRHEPWEDVNLFQWCV